MSVMATSLPLQPAGRALVALLAGSGTLHLVRPGVFVPLIPRPLREVDRELVLASGVAELVCAAGLAHPRTRRLAGPVTAALFLAVWPANVQMSLSWRRRALRRGDTASRVMYAATLARLPLQWPLVRTALRAGAPPAGAGARVPAGPAGRLP